MIIQNTLISDKNNIEVLLFIDLWDPQYYTRIMMIADVNGVGNWPEDLGVLDNIYF
jgi:hypothetical protein